MEKQSFPDIEVMTNILGEITIKSLTPGTIKLKNSDLVEAALAEINRIQERHCELKFVEKDPLGNQEDEITITPLGIALGIAVEMGIVSKEDPNVLVKFRNYWDKVEQYVLPYAFERMKEGEADHINTPPNSQ